MAMAMPEHQSMLLLKPQIHAPHETTETEYATYELTDPQSYCGDYGRLSLVCQVQENQL